MQTDISCFKPKTHPALLFFVFAVFTPAVYAQNVDSTKTIYHFGGGATLTNNGISLLPTFSLGKPAAIFDMSVGNKKLSFDPQFRFALEGKPWSFIFWWRYKLLRTDKFTVNVGAHPAVLFKTETVSANGMTKETIVAQRYLAGELSPNYFITKDISIGVYYLYSHGFQEDGTQNTHFVTLNSNFYNIRLPGQFYLKFYPQVYYLKMDEKDGFFATATVTLGRRNFPLSLQSILNQAIETNIEVKNDFVWNISLIYAFNKEYVRK